MTNRRIKIKQTLPEEGEKQVARWDGVAGEIDVDTEQYQVGGISYAPPEGEESESIAIEINGDPDNVIALPHGGMVKAMPGETNLYNGATQFVIRNEGVILELIVGGQSILTVQNGRLETSLDIVSNGISLENHRHGGVRTGGGTTGEPV
jgi:phage baseplate assembly protein gpV